MPSCDRCGNKNVVIQASAFCVECEDVWLCVACFTWHVVECIDNLPEITDHAGKLVYPPWTHTRLRVYESLLKTKKDYSM